MAESVTIAVCFNDMTPMGNSIQQGACKTFGAKYIVLFLKREIGSYHNALVFICSADYLKQEFCVGFGKRNISQFIKDEEEHTEMILFEESLHFGK
jgi:hypothetical protein